MAKSSSPCTRAHVSRAPCNLSCFELSGDFSELAYTSGSNPSTGRYRSVLTHRSGWSKERPPLLSSHEGGELHRCHGRDWLHTVCALQWTEILLSCDHVMYRLFGSSEKALH